MLSSVSAMSMDSANGNMSMSNEASSAEIGESKKGEREQRKENQKERSQMNHEIKDDRMEMNHEIKDDKMKMHQENMDNRQMMGSGMTHHVSTGELKNFLRNPLTSEEQLALKALIKTHKTELKSLKKDETLTTEQKAGEMQKLMSVHMTSMLAYISTEKQDAFKKMMEEKMAMMTKKEELRTENKENREEFKEESKEKRQEFKKEAQTKKQALSEKLRGQLTSAIERFPVEKLNKVLANVDKVVTKIVSSALSSEKKERLLAQLEEIRMVIQDKIDMFKGDISEGNILTNVLSGVDSKTTTGTGGATSTGATVTQ